MQHSVISATGVLILCGFPRFKHGKESERTASSVNLQSRTGPYKMWTYTWYASLLACTKSLRNQVIPHRVLLISIVLSNNAMIVWTDLPTKKTATFHDKFFSKGIEQPHPQLRNGLSWQTTWSAPPSHDVRPLISPFSRRLGWESHCGCGGWGFGHKDHLVNELVRPENGTFVKVLETDASGQVLHGNLDENENMCVNRVLTYHGTIQ